MKLEFWQFKYEFDRDDAKIVIPILLLVLALCFTKLNPIILIGFGAIYYFVYFFADDAVELVNTQLRKRRMRCPRCKSRNVFLQGYDGYNSDEHYGYYLCNDCSTTSILIENGLMDVSSRKAAEADF
ncbi:hypothetical protein DW352_18000 [Pseudolabrys taiwanensis]|uniref:Uncharacterized protein n=1 Tax=Pseudolabrys taiwanensis TaxID=331696 RepID=A0A345ZZA1_9HYPH|nr:hypothetical protein DW352_18000 [Pseudolabrys taiwanensis]